MINKNKLLTIQETASLLSVHWQSVRKYIRAGQLPIHKIGRNIRIDPSDLKQFIDDSILSNKGTVIKKNKKLVVVADDLGLTRSVNDGIAYCIKNNSMIREVSLMINAIASEHAVEAMRALDFKCIGLHLCLLPWTKEKRPHRSDYIDLFKRSDVDDLRSLFLKEVEEFVKLTGKKPSHICPQYGIHANLKLLGIVIEYCKVNDIPIRIPFTALSDNGPDLADNNYAGRVLLERANITTTNKLFGHVAGTSAKASMDSFLLDISNIEDEQSVEFLFHPGFVDEELLTYSSLNMERARDISILINKDFKEKIIDLGFEIVSYKELKK